MGGACSTHGGDKNSYKILVGKPEGRRQLGRPLRKWKDNIRTYLRETGWEGVDWMHLAPDRETVAGSCEHSNEPSDFIKDGEFFD
jgi:hypothetical protein